jgi:hypothetical protein
MESTRKSLQRFLDGNGWQSEDKVIWKRGDLRVALLMPMGWSLAKPDINAPRDLIEVATGVNVAELDKCLRDTEHNSCQPRGIERARQ